MDWWQCLFLKGSSQWRQKMNFDLLSRSVTNNVCVCVYVFVWQDFFLCVRLEVWCCVQPFWCFPSWMCPPHRCSWLPVTATRPQGRASRRSGTVCCVISCCCCCSIYHGCTWDRSNNRGTQRPTHSHLECFFPLSVKVIWVSDCFCCHSCHFRGFLLTALLMENWMRQCCRTVNMTCWSLPRSISDSQPTRRGETKNMCRCEILVTHEKPCAVLSEIVWRVSVRPL